MQNAKNCDFEKSDEQLAVAMEYLHRLHDVEPDETIKVFDNVAEGKKLMNIVPLLQKETCKESSLNL